MGPLQERARRIDLSFPVSFQEGKLPVSGHCQNLSESGLLATFDQDLELWTEGVLTMQHGRGQIALRARVARATGCQAGIAFVFRSEGEREEVRQVVDQASRETQLVGKPPF